MGGGGSSTPKCSHCEKEAEPEDNAVWICEEDDIVWHESCLKRHVLQEDFEEDANKCPECYEDHWLTF